MAAAKDELAERRFRKLVDHLHETMGAGLKPEYRGYYGQLILSRDAVAELGEVAEVRRAARAAGHELGWRVRTHVADDGCCSSSMTATRRRRYGFWQDAEPPRPSQPSSPARSTVPACAVPASITSHLPLKTPTIARRLVDATLTGELRQLHMRRSKQFSRAVLQAPEHASSRPDEATSAFS
ncbi:hypothetical protein [Nonomuraea sp. LPB2021202275-12-8]|uniref:hypothetical protein n=1 Tax=Nonomuraea sp. LPB2021202275-12-8 TaxID=3120159 RepID=UPI00300CB78D